MEKSKTFSEEMIGRLADLLSAIGKYAWSERPQTYLVLQRINQVRLMDSFVLDGYKDIDFPYIGTMVPNCVNAAGVVHELLQQQR